MSSTQDPVAKMLGDLLMKLDEQNVLLERIFSLQQAQVKGVDKTDHYVEQVQDAADAVMRGEKPPSQRELAKRCGIRESQFRRMLKAKSKHGRLQAAFREFLACKQSQLGRCDRTDFVDDDFVDAVDRRLDQEFGD